MMNFFKIFQSERDENDNDKKNNLKPADENVDIENNVVIVDKINKKVEENKNLDDVKIENKNNVKKIIDDNNKKDLKEDENIFKEKITSTNYLGFFFILKKK
jgi:Pyruvate/2-oxoacid:ferredoxin oxidoreductase gamma subunit